MARRGIFRRIADAAKNAVTSTVEATKSAATTTVRVVKKPFTRKPAPKPLPPFSLKSPDAMFRAQRQQALRAKREALMVKKSMGDVDDRVRRYLSMNQRDRGRYHPQDAEARFWDMYDRGGA